MAVTCLEKFEKQPGESLRYTVDVTQILEAGEDVSGTPMPTVTATPPGLSITSVGISRDPQSVSFRVAGGISGRDYRTQIHFETLSNNVREVDVIISVRDE